MKKRDTYQDNLEALFNKSLQIVEDGLNDESEIVRQFAAQTFLHNHAPLFFDKPVKTDDALDAEEIGDEKER